MKKTERVKRKEKRRRKRLMNERIITRNKDNVAIKTYAREIRSKITWTKRIKHTIRLENIIPERKRKKKKKIETRR